MSELIGIDPDATVVIEYRGAKFKVGVVEASVWEPLNHQVSHSYNEAIRQRVGKFEQTDAGQDAMWADIFHDADLRARNLRLFRGIARVCLRGHEGFNKPDGTPVPFIEKDGIVEDETLRWYTVHGELMHLIYTAAKKLHTLGDAEKKA